MKPMPHHTFLHRVLAALALAATFSAPPLRAAERPNIVFILADDLGTMDIGANNPKTFYETPNIDGIARTGMRFTQGYAACPVCSPTRASIVTGKYPPRTGVTDYIGGSRSGKLLPAPNADHLPLEEVTIAERLRDAGYATFTAGKWHLGTGAYSPNAQGFGPGLVGSGQFYYPPSPPATDPKEDPKTTDRIADAAVRFIEAHQDTPFFAYLPFQAVHTPIRAAQALVEKYERKKASAPPDAWGRERANDVRLVQNHAVYAAMLEQLDTAIGRVLAAVDRAGSASAPSWCSCPIMAGSPRPKGTRPRTSPCGAAKAGPTRGVFANRGSSVRRGSPRLAASATRPSSAPTFTRPCWISPACRCFRNSIATG